ncbi:MAG TPA: FGGY-family carbohydrate kinase, partial [Pirellulales bacterium]|nr:FGGY-family carbohydrate kinase [Pirellulales bacterium]
ATHDTASAVLAVPAASSGGNADWCYLSSGTWALMGVESPVPVLSPQALRYNFTNEGGVGRTTRLLKNITGLWLVQECRRTWAAAGNAYRWDALAKLAAEAPSAQAFIDPDAAEFSSPCDMPEVIRTFCRRTGQPVPADDGWVVRVCLESIAMRSRQVLTMLEELTGRRLATIHVVGGGSQNRLLCQMTADACQRRVVTGPVEATVIGNVLMQAMTDGQIGSIAEAREVVGRSFPVEVYEPSTQPSEHFARFLAAIGS